MLTGRFARRRVVSTLCLLTLTAFPAGLSARSSQDAPPRPRKELSPVELADVYMVRKMYREAIDTLCKIDPPTAPVLNRIGIAYQQQDEYALAHDYYRRAIKVQPKYAEAINNLGTIYYAQKKYRHATSLYKRAVTLQPESASIHVNLGMAWLARHNDAEWERQLRTALELDPGVFERRAGHGIVIQERSTEQRAKLDVYLAKLYARRGNNELALQYIAKALEAGYKQRKRLLEDEDFAALRVLPEFDALMKQPPKAL